jgi:phage terminase small subunit
MSVEIAADAANPLQNAKHEAVLQQYFADPARVGWRCYQHVYPNSSQRASETGFSRLLKSAEFSQRLVWLQKSAAHGNIMDLNEVLAELSKLGRASIQDVIVRGDDVKDVVESLAKMEPHHAATIQELTIETYVEGQGEFAREVKRVKVKLHDKRGALSELRRHYEPHKLADPDGRALGTGAVEADAKATEMSELELGRRIAFALEKAARAPRPAAAAPAPTKAKPKGKKVKR